MFSLLFLSASFCVSAQDKTVKGKVTDGDTNESLPGVSILVKGTNRGTTTDMNGDFTINITNDDAVLVCTFIGYQTLEVPVASQTTLNFALKPDVRALDEVVVVGYGTQRKADLTGAVGSLRASDVDIGSKAITSTDQLLGGRVAGIHIANRSGDPGAPIDVRIRGVGTAGVNSPLCIEGCLCSRHLWSQSSQWRYYRYDQKGERRKGGCNL